MAKGEQDQPTERFSCHECGEVKPIEEFGSAKADVGTRGAESPIFTAGPLVPPMCKECAGEY